jgi:plastocyanin
VVALLAAVGLGATTSSPSARAANSPYVVVRADTGGSAARLVRLSASESATVVVKQKNKSFEPATVEIHAGESVELINEDATVHNAFCSAGDFKYNSGPQQPGSHATITFTAAGSYQVRCAIHPKMVLIVQVLDRG